VTPNLVSQGVPEYLEPTLLGNAVYLVADAVVALKYTRHSRITSRAMRRCVVSFTRIIFQQDVSRLSVRTRVFARERSSYTTFAQCSYKISGASILPIVTPHTMLTQRFGSSSRITRFITTTNLVISPKSRLNFAYVTRM